MNDNSFDSSSPYAAIGADDYKVRATAMRPTNIVANGNNRMPNGDKGGMATMQQSSSGSTLTSDDGSNTFAFAANRNWPKPVHDGRDNAYERLRPRPSGLPPPIPLIHPKGVPQPSRSMTNFQDIDKSKSTNDNHRLPLLNNAAATSHPSSSNSAAVAINRRRTSSSGGGVSRNRSMNDVSISSNKATTAPTQAVTGPYYYTSTADANSAAANTQTLASMSNYSLASTRLANYVEPAKTDRRVTKNGNGANRPLPMETAM